MEEFEAVGTVDHVFDEGRFFVVKQEDGTLYLDTGSPSVLRDIMTKFYRKKVKVKITIEVDESG